MSFCLSCCCAPRREDAQLVAAESLHDEAVGLLAVHPTHGQPSFVTYIDEHEERFSELVEQLEISADQPLVGRRGRGEDVAQLAERRRMKSNMLHVYMLAHV